MRVVIIVAGAIATIWGLVEVVEWIMVLVSIARGDRDFGNYDAARYQEADPPSVVLVGVAVPKPPSFWSWLRRLPRTQGLWKPSGISPAIDRSVRTRRSRLIALIPLG
jgi:hypothetical protein